MSIKGAFTLNRSPTKFQVPGRCVALQSRKPSNWTEPSPMSEHTARVTSSNGMPASGRRSASSSIYDCSMVAASL